MYIKHGSHKQVINTTKGWHLCVEWKDATTSWEHLEDLNKIKPIEVSEYALSKHFHYSPPFVWWVRSVLKNHSRIIADVTKIYHTRTHKFDIEVPKIWGDCMVLDT
jgi:hypothetical protein